VPQVFGESAGAAAWAPAPFLWPAALVTAAVGFAGVFTARTLSEQAAYAIIGSTGTLLIAVAGWQEATLAAALFYLVHSTLAGAALFLVADVVSWRRAGAADNCASGPDFSGRQGVGLLFMAAAIATIGLPPLSGFIGKLLILSSATALPQWGWAWPWTWAVILGTTLIAVIGFARAGSAIFWKVSEGAATTPPTSRADYAAPVIALLALLIKRESPGGPVFFAQTRVGAGHRPFTLWKLRSMVPEAAASDGERQSTARGDARLLRIGAFMRRWNLDELPQFWNVIRGDMSLVGPRPERPYHVDRLSAEIPHYLPRHLAKPGMSGWAQVNGLRGESSIARRIQHDIYYIENWSLWLDLQIIALTFVRWKNAY
jgi:lipopolysaccharide/colanic/teichoic acid biosynthesis glycosyltransferase